MFRTEGLDRQKPVPPDITRATLMHVLGKAARTPSASNVGSMPGSALMDGIVVRVLDPADVLRLQSGVEVP